MTRLLALAVVLAACAAAQPVVETGGVLNAASYALTGLPNSAIAQGSIFTVFGRGMAASGVQRARFPLTNDLEGTSVEITIGGSTVAALMLWTTPAQIACVLPSSTPTGTGTLRVTYNRQASNPAPITVAKTSFGGFALNEAGSGPGLFTDASYNANTLSSAAQPNETWVAWGTGLGPVSFDERQGAPAREMTEVDVEVYVGMRRADVAWRGRAPNFSGLDQINFRIPPGVEGCYVPVVVKAGGVVSNFTTMSIAASGRTCSDPHGLSAADIEQGRTRNVFNLGAVALSKTEISLPPIPGLGELSLKLETGSADFVRYDFNRLMRTRGATGYPPLGQCVVYGFVGQSFDVTDPVQATGLDAGNLSLTGPKGTKQFTLDSRGHYSAQLGGSTNPLMPAEEYLVKGTYTITATGGTDVRAFTATLNLLDPLRWTNWDVNVIPRAQDLRVTWSGGDATREYMTLVGVSTRTAPEVGAVFLCTERVAAGALTVPALVLSALPASQAGGGLTGVPAGMLMLGTSPLMEPTRFQATGLDAAYFYYTAMSGRSVTFQ